MDNIKLLKKELAKSLKYHLIHQVVPRALTFARDEISIFINKKIKELDKNNDNAIKPQHFNRKSQDSHSIKRVRKDT